MRNRERKKKEIKRDIRNKNWNMTISTSNDHNFW
jgi:hypothetical protein